LTPHIVFISKYHRGLIFRDTDLHRIRRVSQLLLWKPRSYTKLRTVIVGIR